MTSGFLSSISSAVTTTGPLTPCRDTVSKFPVLAVDTLAPVSVTDSGEPVLVCWSSSSCSKQSPHMPPRTRRVTTAANPTTPRVTTIPAITHRTGVTWGNAGKEVAAATQQWINIQVYKMGIFIIELRPALEILVITRYARGQVRLRRNPPVSFQSVLHFYVETLFFLFVCLLKFFDRLGKI